MGSCVGDAGLLGWVGPCHSFFVLFYLRVFSWSGWVGNKNRVARLYLLFHLSIVFLFLIGKSYVPFFMMMLFWFGDI